MQIFLADIANQQVMELTGENGNYTPCVGDARLVTSQEDVGLKCKVILTDNGCDYVIPDGGALSVWYMGSSGKGNYTAVGEQSAFSVSGNEVEIEIVHQMLLRDGAGLLWLILNLVDGSRKTLMKLPYITVSGPDSDSPEAQQYYQAFSEQIAQLMEKVNAFDTDKTLSVSDMAADAAAVGEAITDCAPAGYGLGEELVSATLLDDLNDITCKTGYYAYHVNTENRPASNFGGGFVLVQKYSDSVVYQKVWNNSPACVCQRRYYDGVWDEWEWLNPPMVPDTEYLTGEYYNSKPIYTMLVTVGGWEDEKSVVVELGSPVRCVRSTGTVTGYVLPYIHGGDIASAATCLYTVQPNTLGCKISLYGGTNTFAGVTTWIRIWYYK